MKEWFGVYVLSAVLLLLPACSAKPVPQAGSSSPRFVDHPAAEKFTGSPAAPDFESSPDAKRFATRIREGVRQGPNFAGRYTIVEWGCGTECQYFIIVDAVTGAIYSPSFSSAWGLLYRQDSSLLIVNPVSSDMLAAVNGKTPEWLVTGFYRWDGKNLSLICERRNMIIDPQSGAARDQRAGK